jgi:hypothetical protein
MTRKLPWLAALPFGGVALFIVSLFVFPTEDARAIAIRTAIEISKAMALTGALAAAFTFQPGDHLRRAWLYVAACSGFLLVRDLFLIPSLANLDPFLIPWLRSGLAVVANACGVIGAMLIASAWAIPGVALPGSRMTRGGLLFGAAVIALLVAGPSTWLRVQEAYAGNARAVGLVASGIADMLQLTLLAPVLMTAIALRGGLLSWTFFLLAASQFSWLFYDALAAYGELVWGAGLVMLAGSECFRLLANGYTFAAGLAQRSVVLAARPRSTD